MTNISGAHVAPVSQYDFLAAIGASREAEPLTPRQKFALEHPPQGVTIRDEDAQRDGFFASRHGRVDLYLYADFMRKNNENRVAFVEAAIETLRSKSALPIERVERLAREIAALRSVPDELAALLDCQCDPPPNIAADRLESALKKIATEAQRNQRARVI